MEQITIFEAPVIFWNLTVHFVYYLLKTKVFITARVVLQVFVSN